MDNQYSFGEALRGRRLQQELSLNTLAALSGLDKSVLSRLESGAIAHPSISVLRRLAPALQLTETELFGLLSASSRERLPALQPYLRAKYDLPDQAIADITAYLSRYGVPGVGPADGEDEKL